MTTKYKHLPDEKFINKFWLRVKKTRGCWHWIGDKHAQGYGVIIHEKDKVRKNIRAHRFAYTLIKGKIPEKMQLDHLCRNTSCVNPKHLEIVTSKENTLRGNGVTAQNARKKFCLRGHPFNKKNTIIKSGGRNCRECDKIHHKKYKTKLKKLL